MKRECTICENKYFEFELKQCKICKFDVCRDCTIMIDTYDYICNACLEKINYVGETK